MSQETAKRTHRRELPVTVTWLLIGVLIIAILHLIRFWQAVSQWDFLASLPGVSPLYLAATGLFWGAAGLLVLYALWKRWPARRPAMFFYALAYSLFVWIDLYWVAKARPGTIDGASLPFKAFATIAFLAFAAYALGNRKAREYFTSSGKE